MTETPEYYERIAAEFAQRTGIPIDAWFVQRTEEVSGKPFGEASPADLDQALTVVQAESAVYVASQEQAIEWSRTIAAAMEKRRAANVRELHRMLLAADDPDAATELAALKSFAAFMAAENETP
jgi:hypothetical protein